MVLPDTSVWVEHLRGQNTGLAGLLSRASVLMHPFIAGELACGNLAHRQALLRHLAYLPAAISASDAEVMALIERRKLWGRGIGWVDAHLLASALLSDCELWTLDRALNGAAEAAGVRRL